MSTSESHFYFHLLRISVAQMLKNAGFDRCAPSTLNLVTDLYTRHLSLLLKEALKLLELSGRGQDLQVQDIAQAFVNIGLIKPVTLLDPFDHVYKRETSIDLDSNNYNDGMKLFLDWSTGDCPEQARTLSRPTKEMIALAKNTTLGLPSTTVRENPNNPLRPVSSFVIPSSSHLQDSSAMTPGSSFHSLDLSSMQMAKTPAAPEEEFSDHVDWFAYLMMKQHGKLGAETRFQGTILEPLEKSAKDAVAANSDFIILGETPETLIDCLPYTQHLDMSDEEY
ncbi:hypothetical protein BABINDRAFT_159234 [Babjeviella inositovora NRRL Y-12698]|uniref:Bromodomain associated domain-containing protein n=1 Tax=Babjeviella inositovora NRRL Y-12698 TaxID=984486 RepID=A0A1E3QYF1_9ASCO|nr:uncharacterized protein BABINDRAFT_159234 [Babjeviella inositovora NRRL Y-12698]ODQ82709.1 hypothetical protein BABINDRAFT_159234 [Babjeviella inositovora NRRL Y-12698]